MAKRVSIILGLSVIIAFSLGVVVTQSYFKTEEPPYQTQAYGDMGFLQFYKSDVRDFLFSDEGLSKTTLNALSAELKKSLIGMRSRVMFELKSLNIEREGFNAYYRDSKAYSPYNHELYMHTFYFTRLADWQSSYKGITETELKKFNDIKFSWNYFDRRAKKLDLVSFNWGTARHSGLKESENSFEYTPNDERISLINSLVSHFTDINNSLNKIDPVFIDFARDPKLSELMVIKKIHDDKLPITRYNTDFLESGLVKLNKNQDIRNKVIELLRNTTFTPTESVDIEGEEPYVLSGKHFQIHFINNDTVYVIYERERDLYVSKKYEVGFFKVDKKKLNDIKLLLAQTIN